MALSLDRISTQLAKDLYQSTDQVRGACAGIIFKFKIGDMAALPASTNEKRARVIIGMAIYIRPVDTRSDLPR